MDFNLKQWRHDDESASEEQKHEEDSVSPSKLPRLVLNSNSNHRHHQYQQQENSVATALPLFVAEGEGPNPTNLPPYHCSASSDANNNNKFPRMGGSGCFSLGQWQELELQALIYRHLSVGGTVPQELVRLVQKSLVSSHPSSYYFSHPLYSQYYPHYQAANLVQSGYWGRAAMDPEPGRCRRTDGKKWRCSRDVVVGQKYCERHMNRGKNRSRKPVEVNPTSAATAISMAANGGGETSHHPIAAAAQGKSMLDFGGGGSRFTLSGSSPSLDLLHLSQRPKSPFETAQNDDQNPGGVGRVLRPFFDDWQVGSSTHMDNSAAASITDFSLKLGMGGNGVEPRVHHVMSGEAQQSWESNSQTVAHMGGGPLAEALRSSSGSTSSPKSVLHRLQREQVSSGASYVTSRDF